MESDLPSILKKHNFDVKRILDETNFPLLEQEIPGLCADRLDYFLRDMLVCEILTQKQVDYFLENLIVVDGKIVMKNKESAKLMGKKYIKGNYELWAPIFVVGQYNLLALIIKSALKRGVIKEDDLFRTDDEVYNTLWNDQESKEKLRLLDPEVDYIENPKDYDFYIKTKLRYVDPLFLEDGKIKRLSEEDLKYKESLQKLKDFIAKGFHIKIVRGDNYENINY
jgi:HD superfamily phosphohydrolase